MPLISAAVDKNNVLPATTLTPVWWGCLPSLEIRPVIVVGGAGGDIFFLWYYTALSGESAQQSQGNTHILPSFPNSKTRVIHSESVSLRYSKNLLNLRDTDSLEWWDIFERWSRSESVIFISKNNPELFHLKSTLVSVKTPSSSQVEFFKEFFRCKRDSTFQDQSNLPYFLLFFSGAQQACKAKQTKDIRMIRLLSEASPTLWQSEANIIFRRGSKKDV